MLKMSGSGGVVYKHTVPLASSSFRSHWFEHRVITVYVTVEAAILQVNAGKTIVWLLLAGSKKTSGTSMIASNSCDSWLSICNNVWPNRRSCWGMGILRPSVATVSSPLLPQLYSLLHLLLMGSFESSRQGHSGIQFRSIQVVWDYTFWNQSNQISETNSDTIHAAV